jgi:hypothetical protein
MVSGAPVTASLNFFYDEKMSPNFVKKSPIPKKQNHAERTNNKRIYIYIYIYMYIYIYIDR